MELLKMGLGNIPEQLYLNQLANLRNPAPTQTQNLANLGGLTANLQGFNGLPQYYELQNTLEAKNYYQEAYNLYLTNNIITSKINDLLLEKSQILMRLALLDKAQNPIQYKLSQIHPSQNKKKRHRRSANQIDRHYKCPVITCAKTYGSEGSLYQHIKLKHPSFNIGALIAAKEKKLEEAKKNNLNNMDSHNAVEEDCSESSDARTTTEDATSPSHKSLKSFTIDDPLHAKLKDSDDNNKQFDTNH